MSIKPKKVTEKVEGVPGLERVNEWYSWRRMVGGKMYRKALNTKNYARAVAEATKLNDGIDLNGQSPALVVNKDSKLLQTALDEYIHSRPIREKSLLRYTSIAANICEGFGKVLNKREPLLADICREAATEYVRHRLNTPILPNGHKNARTRQGISPKSLNDELMVLKGALKYSVKKEWLAKVPDLDGVTNYKSRKGKASEVARPLEVEELKAVLKAAEAYDAKHAGEYAYPSFWQGVIKSYVYAGLRRDELKYLEWSDVIFRQNIIKVRPKRILCRRVVPFTSGAWGKIKDIINLESNAQAVTNNKAALRIVSYALNFRSESALLALKGKDFDPDNLRFTYSESIDWQPKGTSGEVPMNPNLRKTLEELHTIKTSNFVFPGTDGGYWRFHVDKSLKSIFKAAGITDNVRTHDLRHTCGYLLRRAGVGLETIKEILRHSDIAETMVYAKYNQEEGQSAVNKLPDL